MSEIPSVSREPLNLLFNMGGVSRKNVWDIDLLNILNMLARVLEKKDGGDLRMAGVAILSSTLIYKMKVDSIFALHQETVTKSPPPKRKRVDIAEMPMPYRHQSTYAVTLDELLAELQNLVVSIANPRTRRSSRLNITPVDVPDIKEHMLSLELAIKPYQDLILEKLRHLERTRFQDMASELDSLDSVRLFFAILFLASNGRITLEQNGDDIMIMMSDNQATH